MFKNEDKFKFTTEYQWDLLRYTVQDKNGVQALKKYDDDYFTLIEHQIIAYALKVYYKKHNVIPGETILREEIVRLLNSRQYINLVTKEQQSEIINQIKPLYNKVVKDGDVIYQYCKDFRSHIRLKKVIEAIDINDFSRYKQFAEQVQAAITDEDKKDSMEESFLLSSLRDRQLKRQQNSPVKPTPFTQINKLTNAGGYEDGSILVLLDRPKRGKTAMLANIARGYLKMRKRILIVDLENGRQNIFFRLEQSIMNLTKAQLISGEFDSKVQRRFRKYARLGGEIVVERLPALATDTNDIQNIIDMYYRDYGIQFDILIIDYAAKMASLSKKDNDTSRISDVYLELGNLAIKNNIEHVWTANHVTREAARSRMKTRYVGEDIASAIDIVRHASAVFGLNRSEPEEEAGFMRMEIVDQRDGVPSGRAVFNMNIETQRAEELTSSQRKVYDTEFYPNIVGDKDNTVSKKTPKKQRDNDFSD